MKGYPPRNRLLPRAGWEVSLGGFMLIHYALVCGVKVSQGLSLELWWMSHVALLMGGVGVLARRPLLVSTALTNVLVLHALWLADFAWGRSTGVYPFAASSYLVGADGWTWLATCHHFYLVPVLILFLRFRPSWPRETILAASAIYLYLTIISRGFLPPTSNVNFAFRVLYSVDNPALRWFNGLPGSLYLVLLNLFVSVGMFLPTDRMFRGFLQIARTKGGGRGPSPQCPSRERLSHRDADPPERVASKPRIGSRPF